MKHVDSIYKGVYTFLTVVLSVCILSVPLFSHAADGLFGIYFERMTGPCASGYILTGFDQTTGNFGTKTCTPFSTLLGSIFGTTTAPAGQAVLGFTPTGGLRYGSVNWINAGSNIYYTGSNVGIGTISPSVRLDVVGEISARNGNNSTIYIGGDADPSNDLEIGSITAGRDLISFWNRTDARLMNIQAKNATFHGNGSASNQSVLKVTSVDGTTVATGWPTEWGGGIQTWDILAMSAKLNGGLLVKDDIVMNGQNGWRFHSPDDGRTSLWFGKQSYDTITSWPYEFRADGRLRVGGGIEFPDGTTQTTAAAGNTACDREGKIRIYDGNLQRCFTSITYTRNVQGGWYSNRNSCPNGYPTCDSGDTEISRSYCVTVNTRTNWGDRQYLKQNQITCQKPSIWKTWNIPATYFQ